MGGVHVHCESCTRKGNRPRSGVPDSGRGLRSESAAAVEAALAVCAAQPKGASQQLRVWEGEIVLLTFVLPKLMFCAAMVDAGPTLIRMATSRSDGIFELAMAAAHALQSCQGGTQLQALWGTLRGLVALTLSHRFGEGVDRGQEQAYARQALHEACLSALHTQSSYSDVALFTCCYSGQMTGRQWPIIALRQVCSAAHLGAEAAYLMCIDLCLTQVVELALARRSAIPALRLLESHELQQTTLLQYAEMSILGWASSMRAQWR